VDDTEPITSFTEKEATTLLEYMVWDHSHEDDYITEAQVDGKRQRATWKSEISTPSLTTHLAGERYFGVKKGRMTLQIAPELDRHSGEVPGEYHVVMAIKVGQVLTRRFPHLRFAPASSETSKSTGWRNIKARSAGSITRPTRAPTTSTGYISRTRNITRRCSRKSSGKPWPAALINRRRKRSQPAKRRKR
jgi:hypothetical protein